MSDPKLILAVDDDASILEVIQITLEGEGYGVKLAGDVARALELVERIRPGLILLDMGMPRANGWQFAEAYRKLPGPHVPIVVMTGSLDPAAAASQIGARHHLAKPFDVEDLIEIVRSCLLDGAS